MRWSNIEPGEPRADDDGIEVRLLLCRIVRIVPVRTHERLDGMIDIKDLVIYHPERGPDVDQ